MRWYVDVEKVARPLSLRCDEQDRFGLTVVAYGKGEHNGKGLLGEARWLLCD